MIWRRNFVLTGVNIAMMATRKLCAATLSGFLMVRSHPVRGICLSASIAWRKSKKDLDDGVVSMMNEVFPDEMFFLESQERNRRNYMSPQPGPRFSNPAPGRFQHYVAIRITRISAMHIVALLNWIWLLKFFEKWYPPSPDACRSKAINPNPSTTWWGILTDTWTFVDGDFIPPLPTLAPH